MQLFKKNSNGKIEKLSLKESVGLPCTNLPTLVKKWMEKKNAWIAFMTQVSGAVKLGLEAN